MLESRKHVTKTLYEVEVGKQLHPSVRSARFLTLAPVCVAVHLTSATLGQELHYD